VVSQPGARADALEPKGLAVSAPGGGLPLIVIEIFLGFGVPLAWAVWQLIELKKLKRQDEEKARQAQREAQDADAPSVDGDTPKGNAAGGA
jgi:hypothetical protein